MGGIPWFRRLAVVAAIFAYLQIALGGVVRVTGSGLGCPDWPLCHGRPYPPANLGSIIEYSHRAVGSVTELLILATFFVAWVVWRSRRPVVAWLASASLVGAAHRSVPGVCPCQGGQAPGSAGPRDRDTRHLRPAGRGRRGRRRNGRRAVQRIARRIGDAGLGRRAGHCHTHAAAH